ncbi:class 1b ribonucleoside-diphosphate reductase subunit alpha [Melghirimyces algeriensis]|uniref:Ribonucleoside-diphosphate reductase n=1 Tax=Melghirimyces algeriensis TaxID=910412 RepID=A0A521F7E6_9BACL|nr:class 1b ribonucleoside-diphosphate reductase subunit alpha [Melghirimyces algeriensis]SMO92138.1 ribonucleoside-diphosphate reductase class Ib alpha subunit [Melghirimyces algeriensis]
MKHIELNSEIMTKVGGFYQLEKDSVAVTEFMREVDGRSMKFSSPISRMEWLIENEFYENFFEKYSRNQIRSLLDLAYRYDFKFQSYMAVSKFYRDYALKTDDKEQYLEHYEDRVVACALFLGGGDYLKAERFVKVMMEQRYQPATPTFMNAGRKRRGEMVSCFLLEMDDSLNSINYNINTAMQLSKIGGGVAVNLSKIRGRGEAIKGVEGVAKGVVPVMKLLEDGFSYADQLGQRPGAGAAYLNVFHWDVLEFLETKKINADEKIRIKTMSIGLVIPDKFFELAEKNEPYYILAPLTVYKEYGKHMDDMDMDEMYDKLITNPRIKKRKMDARELLNKIAATQLQSGYPYIMYKDNANRLHTLSAVGDIKITNLCTEIFQLQETSQINEYDEDNIIKRDISCNLGSLNIVNVMESRKIRESVHAGIDALTSVSDIVSIGNAPGVRKANEELHSVGLGAMNLHGFFAKNKIQYESEEARDFVRTFFMLMNYYSLEKSMLIAKERGVTFKDFDKSDYANGKYFDKYLEKDFLPRTEKVRELFDLEDIPTQEAWAELRDQVRRCGLYHAYRLAIAPTQSISYVQNATSSVMPIVDHVETRVYGNATTYYPMPFMSPETYWYYKSAYNIDQFKMIDLIAEIQQHVDQGISTILYVNSDISTNELARYYIYAHKKGLKSLYYTRNRMLDVSECTSCSV